MHSPRIDRCFVLSLCVATLRATGVPERPSSLIACPKMASTDEFPR